jgi:hypothetical protein
MHRSERVWLFFGVAMLTVFLGVITTAAVVDGFVPPSRVQTIDPTKVSQTPPFDHPGLHKIGDGVYEAYYVARIFSFSPASIEVPAGSRVTFYVTSADKRRSSSPRFGARGGGERAVTARTCHTLANGSDRELWGLARRAQRVGNDRPARACDRRNFHGALPRYPRRALAYGRGVGSARISTNGVVGSRHGWTAFGAGTPAGPNDLTNW